jgi:hypothetical protein
MKLRVRRVLLGAVLAALMFPAAGCVIRDRDPYYYRGHYYRDYYYRDYDGRHYRYYRYYWR